MQLQDLQQFLSVLERNQEALVAEARGNYRSLRDTALPLQPDSPLVLEANEARARLPSMLVFAAKQLRTLVNLTAQEQARRTVPSPGYDPRMGVDVGQKTLEESSSDSSTSAAPE